MTRSTTDRGQGVAQAPPLLAREDGHGVRREVSSLRRSGRSRRETLECRRLASAPPSA
jgi:hypothetical protein